MSTPVHRTDVSVEGIVDVLDTLLERGVSVSGDVIISLAGVDLIQLDLRLLLTGVSDAYRLNSGVAT